MARTKLFGMLAALGAALALALATASPAAAETTLTEPEGTITLDEVDVAQADTDEVSCAAATDRTEVRIREAPETDGAVMDMMEPGTWYSAACDSTAGGEYSDACGDGFHWLEVYIGDSVGYVALMCLDQWVEVDV